MGVSTTQLGATASSAGPSSTVTQARTCGIQLRAVVRLGLGMREGKRRLSQNWVARLQSQFLGICVVRVGVEPEQE